MISHLPIFSSKTWISLWTLLLRTQVIPKLLSGNRILTNNSARFLCNLIILVVFAGLDLLINMVWRFISQGDINQIDGDQGIFVTFVARDLRKMAV